MEVVKAPKLSIVIPAYNIEKYIGECIDSVLVQDYPNKEIIVIDDGSKDNTPAVIQKYADRGEVIFFKKENGGPSSVRNMGMDKATGEFITFVDGDDVVEQGTYSLNMQYFEHNNDVDFVAFPLLFRWTSTMEELNTYQPQCTDDKPKLFQKYLDFELTFSSCDKIFRRSLLNKVRYLEGVYFEDMDFNRQLIIQARKVQLSNKGLYKYRRTENSIVTSNMTPQKIENYFRVNFDFLAQSRQFGLSNRLIHKYLSRWLRLKYLLLYDQFTLEVKHEILSHVQKLKISKFDLLLEFTSGGLSLKKFRSLWALSSGDIYKSVYLSTIREKEFRKENHLREL